MSAENANPESEFIFSREFDAPIQLVWNAWAEAEHLAKWWGPKDFDLTIYKFEFKPEGEFHYGMKAHNGFEMWGKFIFKEMTAPNKLTYISGFADKNGHLSRAPFFDGKWPIEIFNEVTFTEKNGKTTICLKAVPVNAEKDEVNVFIDTFKSMQIGFGGTFDKLEEHLSQTK